MKLRPSKWTMLSKRNGRTIKIHKGTIYESRNSANDERASSEYGPRHFDLCITKSPEKWIHGIDKIKTIKMNDVVKINDRKIEFRRRRFTKVEFRLGDEKA